MVLEKGLHGTHKDQKIEWVCPECPKENEGHVGASLIDHEQSKHHDRQPHSVIMVCMTPCPAEGCHMVFPFPEDLWDHMHHMESTNPNHHDPDKRHGLGQVMAVFIPVNEEIRRYLHPMYEVSGHGSRRGKRKELKEVHKGDDKYKTKDAQVKSHPHPAGHSKPLHIDTRTDRSHNYSQLPGAFPQSPESNTPSPDYHSTSSEPGGFTPYSETSGYGSGFDTQEILGHPSADELRHANLDNYGPQDSSSQLRQHKKGIHLVAMPRRFDARATHHGAEGHDLVGKRQGTDAQDTHHGANTKCESCHKDFQEGVRIHIEVAPVHRNIYTCWHCGATFGKKNKELIEHVDEKHAKEERDEKLPCAHAGCSDSCRNAWHQRQRLIIDHHEKAADQSLATIEHPGSKDHDKSQGHRETKGHGSNTDGHGKDSHGNEAHDTHHAEGPKQCAGCKKILPDRDMIEHLMAHPAEHRRKYSCWHCGVIFGKNEQHLLAHMDGKKHKKEKWEDKKVPCTHAGCSKILRNDCHLAQHIDMEHGAQPAKKGHPNSQHPDSKDHDKSQGHGEGKEHSSTTKPDGHGNDSHGKETGKDHAKSDGEMKGKGKV
jgi:hypothetical protein